MREIVMSLILKNGTGTGIIKEEIGVGNLICYRIPRTRLKEIPNLSGIDKNGVYILFGEDDSGRKKAYIGKSTKICNRLNNHKINKDFWNEVLVFVTENNKLSQSHIAYLEYKLYEEAKRINTEYIVEVEEKYKLENSQNPQDPQLCESDEIIAKEYMDAIKIFVSTFKHNLFEDYKKEKSNNKILYLNHSGEELGKGVTTDDGFLVLKGSKIRRKNSKIPETLLKRYNAELNSEDIEDDIYIRDHLFKSPSTAALILSGTNLNGRDCWKDSKGRSIKEIDTGKEES